MSDEELQVIDPMIMGQDKAPPKLKKKRARTQSHTQARKDVASLKGEPMLLSWTVCDVCFFMPCVDNFDPKRFRRAKN